MWQVHVIVSFSDPGFKSVQIWFLDYNSKSLHLITMKLCDIVTYLLGKKPIDAGGIPSKVNITVDKIMLEIIIKQMFPDNYSKSLYLISMKLWDIILYKEN